MRWQWRRSITRPIREFQLNYVPVVMVYFAYGALGLVDVALHHALVVRVVWLDGLEQGLVERAFVVPGVIVGEYRAGRRGGRVRHGRRHDHQAQ